MACVVISDTISVMLGTHEQFRRFTPKAVCDTTLAVEVLMNLTFDSRAEVRVRGEPDLGGRTSRWAKVRLGRSLALPRKTTLSLADASFAARK